MKIIYLDIRYKVANTKILDAILNMNRSYYSDTISNFINEDSSSILGKLNTSHTNENLNIKQTRAWEAQIDLLKTCLADLADERVLFEFAIPRMGKRVDNIVVLGNHILVIEFKIGSDTYDKSSINQVVDYALDLFNFHETSHSKSIVPILVSTNAATVVNSMVKAGNLYEPILCNTQTLRPTISNLLELNSSDNGAVDDWEQGRYKPTPTIIEAAQALYNGHSVEDISRYEAGETNLFNTTNELNKIIERSKSKGSKSISFVTGVPGAGKTLVGLNVTNERKKIAEDENAVFLSGNGPLVTVLREALARDRKRAADEADEKLKISDARREVKPTIQNVHHFRNDYLKSTEAPDERVAVFDEAQRAWNVHQTSKFVREKHDLPDFTMSEPHCLIDYMNRHEGWCSVVCLVGGGQEINTGEAGINEWIRTIKAEFPTWDVHYSDLISESTNYLTDKELVAWVKNNGHSSCNLHLGVSVRSFRSEILSAFVENLLNLELEESKRLFNELRDKYPIVLTRNRDIYKGWLNKMKRGSERTGVLVSLNAKRLRPEGIDSENALRSQSDDSKIANWFLNSEEDVRSSLSLEIPSTEFAIQGLELDWACVAWGGDLSLQNGDWAFQKFIGSKWINIGKEATQKYLLNTYRVLLTRARQGMIIFIPLGDSKDITRLESRYNETFEYLNSIGIPEVN
ncbi:MAG: DUF2075 domain-containing protein [Bacteroidetes bacterium]|nr:DUF2075 domain-containing protein [Bacteroidota bacterium]